MQDLAAARATTTPNCRCPASLPPPRSAIFFIGKSTLGCPLEQGEFLFQRSLTRFGQHAQQVLEQDMEPAETCMLLAP